MMYKPTNPTVLLLSLKAAIAPGYIQLAIKNTDTHQNFPLLVKVTFILSASGSRSQAANA
jgi:hypothetical protein